MIDTNLNFCENELQEVLNLFECVKDMRIRHRHTETENKVVNTVTVNGQVYAYGNLIKYDDEIERKRLIKRYAKLSVYKALSKNTGQELPWGALTGIRPTKLAYQQMKKSGEFEEFFIDTMKVSGKKTELTKSVINAQNGIYEKNDENTDFFVFIPFCPSRCRYCSFISADIKSARKHVDDYVETLVDEIRYSKQFIKKLRSIYVGGGTPASLSDEQLDKILSAIDEINNGVEFTVEAGRPDCITESKLAILKKHKVTRICINPQTFSNKTLELIGRKHTADDVVEKYNLAKSDFLVNMDLIAGLDGEAIEDFKSSIDKAIELSPDNITVHTLCIKRGSYLAENKKRLSGADVEKMVEYAHAELKKAGFEPYYLYRQKYMAGNLENVGYAKPNKACIYNVDVMEEISQNVACGANAISKRVYNGGERIERYASPKDVVTYLQKIEQIKAQKRKLFE
ncbi:MAG: coproporphyrinogen dehydrogenase HemZ [Clostridia bacterium]|nr:coproporphyrinogen dehydrogenase HemZ [Clostridia bacterium]